MNALGTTYIADKLAAYWVKVRAGWRLACIEQLIVIFLLEGFVLEHALRFVLDTVRQIADDVMRDRGRVFDLADGIMSRRFPPTFMPGMPSCQPTIR